jgi:hypothetical protein
MRRFAALYDATRGTYSVIAKDDDNYWFIEVPDAGSLETAINIADSLNRTEGAHS